MCEPLREDFKPPLTSIFDFLVSLPGSKYRPGVTEAEMESVCLQANLALIHHFISPTEYLELSAALNEYERILVWCRFKSLFSRE